MYVCMYACMYVCMYLCITQLTEFIKKKKRRLVYSNEKNSPLPNCLLRIVYSMLLFVLLDLLVFDFYFFPSC